MSNLPLPASTARTDTQRSVYAFRVSLVLVTAFVATFGLYLYLAVTQSSWQFYTLAGATAVTAGLNIVAVFVSRRGRRELAATLMIASFVVLFPVATSLLAGVGFTLGIGALIGSVMIASLTLVAPQINRGIAAGVVLGVGIILLDLFFPLERIEVPLLQVYIPVVATVGIGIFAFFIYRELNNYSLRAKLVLAFLIITTISISTLGFFVNRASSDRLTESVGERLSAEGNSRALLVGDELARVINGLKAFSLNNVIQERVAVANASYVNDADMIQARLDERDKRWRAADAANNDNDPLVSDVLFNPVSAELRFYRMTFPENVEVFVTDKFGGNAAASNRTSDYYQADEGWWQAAYNNGAGAIYIGQPEYDESSQTFASIIAVPLYRESTGEVVGILRTTLDLRAITALLESSRLGETGRVELYVANGQKITAEGSGFLPGDINALALPIDSSYHQIDYDNDTSLTSRSPVTSLDKKSVQAIQALEWSLVLHQDIRESLAPVTAQTRTVTLISIALLGLTGLAVFYASQLLTRPVQTLTAVSEKVAAGDFSARAEVTTGDEIGVLATTFNRMTDQLRETLLGLEQRVAERTADLASASRESEQRARDLQSIAEISAAISTEQNINKLLPLITNLISERFDFYHAGIFLVDVNGEYAVLQAANSEGGQRMLARGHKLEVGQTGLVGYAAHTGQARIALDVGADAVFFSNPDLPNTRSEIALPIRVRGNTIGVLDVQSEKSAAFSEADINTLGVLADQVGSAIENARLFGQVQQTLADTQTVYGEYIGEQWARFLEEENQIGYQQSAVGGNKLSAPLTNDAIVQALEKGQLVVGGPNGQEATIAVPIRLRDQVLGVLNVRSGRKDQMWSPDEINMVQAISDRLALTLETARLFQEAQRRATTERAIGEVTAKLSTAQDIDAILRLTATELGRMLEGSKVSIQLSPKSGKK